MSWRTVCVSGRAKLDLRLDCLTVRRQDETLKIHISEISVLIVESTTVSLTAALLSELMRCKVKVIFCDEQHNPQSELLPFSGSHDSALKIREQIRWSEDIKGVVWTRIVREKITKQMLLLAERGLYTQADKLEGYLEQLEYRDESNREGMASKVYFNALFGMDFIRRAEDAPNAALNYGYNILLSVVNREIAANGYLTQLGLFHDNMFNSFNLGSDLMEPFRPLVDKRVCELNPKKFEKEERAYMLGLLSEQVSISGTLQYLPNAIRIYCRSVFDALEAGDERLLRFYH
ncbi:MAG: type II CRISPR-associated endonuclease Cas1 [Oscillospiraceae bacterium]|nr:type II CRISPR-associated endonuclease Cas1 [Oscillospiraceae bacterium]